MLNVGLTGNVASGKSTVAKRLATLGATVLDADTYARAAVAPGSTGLNLIVARFGPRILTSDGTLDRAALGKIVFGNARARADLEAMIHPEVERRRSAALEDSRADGATIVVADIPLLFEAGLEHKFDTIVLVHADDGVRLDRLVHERRMPETDARAVMAAQADSAAKRPRADLVIENNGSLAALEQRVDEVWLALQAREASRRGRPDNAPIQRPDNS